MALPTVTALTEAKALQREPPLLLRRDDPCLHLKRSPLLRTPELFLPISSELHDTTLSRPMLHSLVPREGASHKTLPPTERRPIRHVSKRQELALVTGAPNRDIQISQFRHLLHTAQRGRVTPGQHTTLKTYGGGPPSMRRQVIGSWARPLVPAAWAK